MQDALLDTYDFVVIGGGPSGLLAALTLLKDPARHLAVAMLDKRDPWREPVACAEAVSAQGLARLVPKVEPAWIRQSVDGVIFVAPDGTPVTYTQKGSGYLIDRALMHKNLAEEARRRGAHCHFRTRITAVSRYQGGYRTLRCEGSEGREIRARVVIDASGPGAGFGAGENIVQGDFDLEPALFALVRGLKFPVNYIQLFFGRNYAPGGYAWLFPRDAEVANVGLVIGKDFAKEAPARKTFQAFLDRTYPGAEVETFHGGAIPCGYSEGAFGVENLLKTGDAANMVNPISRAGILEAMQGGVLAAEAGLAIRDLGEDEARKKKHYEAYKNAWDARYGNGNRRIARAKRAFTGIEDSAFDKAAHRLAALPAEKMTMGRIFLTTLWANPGLLWKMRGFLVK